MGLLSILRGGILIKINITWFFYLLVLVFLGGVIVLIIYMNTLAINEKFLFYKVKTKSAYFLMVLISIQILFYTNISIKVCATSSISINLYDSINMINLIFLILYLLLTLICVVKLVKFEYGPLIKRL